LLLILGAVSLWREGGSRRRTLFLLLLLWAVPVLATWISAQGRPIFNERYLIAAAPPFYLLLAAAFTYAVRNSQFTIRYSPFTISPLLPILLIPLLLASLSNHFFNPAYSKTRGWRELAGAFERFSAGLPSEQVRLAQNFPDPTIWYYYTGPLAHLVLPPQANDADGTSAAVSQLAEEGITRVILPVQPAAWWDGSSIAPTALAQQYTLTAQVPVGVWPLEIYSQAESADTSLSADFVNGVRLNGAVLEPDTFAPGGLLVVYLWWATETASLRGSETVFLHLLDRAGQIVGQVDVPLQAGLGTAQPAAYGILLPDIAPVGPYRLIAGLYDPSAPGAPRIGTADGSGFVELGVLK
jgi:hypothetical protein